MQSVALLEQGLGVIKRSHISGVGGAFDHGHRAGDENDSLLARLESLDCCKRGRARVSGRFGGEGGTSPAVEGSVGTASALRSYLLLWAWRGERGSPERWAPSIPGKESAVGSFFVLDSVTSKIGTEFNVDEPHTPISPG